MLARGLHRRLRGALVATLGVLVVVLTAALLSATPVPAVVSLLLKGSGAKDWTAAARRAVEWRAEGMTLHEIGVRLTMDGYQTKEGGIWFPATVSTLLQSIEPNSDAPVAEDDSASMGA